MNLKKFEKGELCNKQNLQTQRINFNYQQKKSVGDHGIPMNLGDYNSQISDTTIMMSPQSNIQNAIFLYTSLNNQ